MSVANWPTHTTGHKMKNYGDIGACEDCGAEVGTRAAGLICPAAPTSKEQK